MDETRNRRGPLDPATDPQRWETAVRSIVTAAGPELNRIAARRPAPVLLMLIDWSRPLVAGSAIIAGLAGATLLASRPQPATAEPVGSVAEAITSEPVAAWLLVGLVPTAEEIVASLRGVPQ